VTPHRHIDRNVELTFKELAGDLRRADPRYCILHGWQALPEYLPSDLDLIVHPEDLQTVEEVLGLRAERRIIQLIEYEASCFFFVLAGLEAEKDLFLQVDTAPDYRRNGRIFFTAEELLAGRRQWNGFWVAAANVEFAYLLVKKVLKGRMPDHQKQRLRVVCRELGPEGLAIGQRLFGPVLGNEAIAWANGAEWDVFERHLRRLRRSLLWRAMRGHPFNPVRFWRAEWGRIWRRQGFPTGLLVAVLGPDGAGKTTLIERLKENLSGAFRRAEVFHLRPGLLGPRGVNGPVTNPHGKPPHPWWLSSLKVLHYLLDYGAGYLFKVRPQLVRSTLVLFDRYYDDLLVDPRRYRYGGAGWLARLARKFIPQPDLVLVLDAPEDVLLGRKQEVSPAELRRECDAYRQLAWQTPRAVLLDGAAAPAEVARQASAAVVEYLHERYLKRRRLWFRERAADTLMWLESVLCPSAPSPPAAALPANGGPSPARRARRTHGWLRCTDGRGYLLPLSSRQAGVGALHLYNAQTLRARALKTLLWIGLKSGMVQPLLRQVHLRGSAPTPPGGCLLEHVQQVLGRQDVQFAISLGMPGPHRKPVLQALAPDGMVIGYVKAGWNEATRALVCNEAGALRRLKGEGLQSFVVPTLLHAGQWEGRALCIQSPPVGSVGMAPKGLTPHYLAAQREMAAVHTRWISFGKSAFGANLWQRIAQVPNSSHRRLLQQGAATVEAWLGERPLPFHFSHGDYTPWNAHLWYGRLYLFDWEYAVWEAPPGYDLFHFSVQTARLLQKRSPWQTWLSIRPGGAVRQLVAEHLQRLGANEVEVEPLWLLYLLERLAFYAVERATDRGMLRYLAHLTHIAMSEARPGRRGDR